MMVKTTTTATPKLSNVDFRYLSAWIQGVEVREAWTRYQSHRGPADARRIRTTTRLLLDLLTGVARRHGLPEAMVLRRDPARVASETSAPPALSASPEKAHVSAGATLDEAVPRLATSAPTPASVRLAVPTLDDLRDSLEDPDFYSEAELIELWQSRYGHAATVGRDAVAQDAGTTEGGRAAKPAPDESAAAPRRAARGATPAARAQARRARLVERQLALLRRLEHLAAAAPLPEDPIEAWLFSSATAARLRAVGLLRLGELLFFIRQHGYRWYRKVPRIGEEGAKRLMAWLQQHEASLGAVAATSLAPRRQLHATLTQPAPIMGVVPLERLVLPVTRSGAEGKNRAPARDCAIEAANDYQAIRAWLNLYAPAVDVVTGEARGSAHTWRAYRKEAERLLLWALFERHKALSDLDALDLAEYRRFLFAPGPAFVGSRSVPRWSEHWRPFEGPLAPRSRLVAESICQALFAWLVQVGYLKHNPWVQLRGGRKAQPLQELRSLSDHQWALVADWLEALPARAANRRLQFMFRLAFVTGMREAELAAARVGWLHQDVDAGGELVWNLHVIGKGQKEREVPLPARFVQELTQHLAAKGLAASGAERGANLGELREFAPELPLLSALDDAMKPMDAKRVYELMKKAFVDCADNLERTDADAAARIRRASPHWLRHTHGRMWVEGGGDRGMLRDRLGHASIATTGIYDRSDVRRQRREVERMFG
ncbi:MAG: tyrosine-type recombinase/integrase [Burkholderiaceae bacterium]|nr:tyrosine-type recombinase/integrase [Burkholderiaceae bacterium]